MTCPFIIYWIRWTQLWIGPRLYQSIMDAPNLRDQMPNTKCHKCCASVTMYSINFTYFPTTSSHWWPVHAMWGIQNFHCKSFRDIFLGSPNSSIIEQHSLALSSKVNNTGGIFSLKYLFNDPGAWSWANSSLREHHWLSQGSLIGPDDNSHQHL